MDTYLIRTDKIINRINALATITEVPNIIVRTYGTDAFMKGRTLVNEWMKAAGLQTFIDNMGNVRGKYFCGLADAKTLVIASHIDTVVNAGKWDGPLGVIMGLDLMEQMIQSKTQLSFNIELIGFCDEEGVRFHTTFLGSKAVVGSFDNNWLQKMDKDGITLKTAMEKMGGDAEKLHEDAMPKNDWLGYFEIHIEQGPVLYERDIPVAVVTAIAGQKRVQLTFTGMAGHAGTVPMNMRQDALCCAAETIVAIELFGISHSDKMVATVGKLAVANAASNVIPGVVVCSLDLRSANENILEDCYHQLQKIIKDICIKRDIDLHWELIQSSQPTLCDTHLVHLLKSAIAQANFETISLVSGAGHDGVAMAEVAPICMLFVRCFKGISHNPLENVEAKDIAATLKVADLFMQQLIAVN